MIRPFSIIIPNYNKTVALNQVWDELQLQVSPDDEILIVDDNSPDGAPEYQCPCSRTIQLPKITPHIYRLCSVRNYGLEHAKHDACIILDPDCMPNPRFLDNARKLYDSNVLYTGCIDKKREDDHIDKDSRRKGNADYWMDLRDKGGSGIWGGCMMFSKSRAKAVGWFNEDFNNGWGAEEHDFAHKCYHSGMRLRYSMGLQVTHLHHPKNTRGSEKNMALWRENRIKYTNNLSTFTPYKPAVAVMVITMLRPDMINQCMQAIYRNRIPIKTRLVNNGDKGEDTRRICKEWGNRWAVDYVHHERKPPAIIRNESMKWAKSKGYKYIVFIDDDLTVINEGITKLVRTAEQHPEYVAISGKLHEVNKRTRLLGGTLEDEKFNYFSNRVGTHHSDWVGGGFTVHRLDPLILYDEEYETGYNDYDWSMTAKSLGHELGVTGDAEAYHAVEFTSKGMVSHQNSAEYNKIRYDEERHNRMNNRFKSKWGFRIKGGAKIVD